MSPASWGERGSCDQGEGAAGEFELILPTGELRPVEASPERAAQHQAVVRGVVHHHRLLLHLVVADAQQVISGQ